MVISLRFEVFFLIRSLDLKSPTRTKTNDFSFYASVSLCLISSSSFLHKRDGTNLIFVIIHIEEKNILCYALSNKWKMFYVF